METSGVFTFPAMEKYCDGGGYLGASGALGDAGRGMLRLRSGQIPCSDLTRPHHT